MDEKETLETTTEEVVETTEQPSEADGRVEELLGKKDVPAELQGLSPEMQEEAMKELNPQQEEETTEQDTEGAGIADTDSVKKTDEPAFKKPNQKIPYERFKEMVDKNNDMKAELEALKAKMAQIESQPKQPAPQPQPQQRPVPQQPAQQNFSVTPDMARQIDDVIKQQAAQMSGLTKEDLESLEYMDDDDARKIRYEHAKEMAKSAVYYNIQQARVQQQLNYQRNLAYHNQVTDNFNAFYTKESAEPDFASVREYATTAYFDTLDDVEKTIVRDANARVERNTASPQDVAVVKRFFLDAKNSYHQQQKAASNAAQAKNATKKIESKYQQQKAFPRASQVNGSAATTGAPSTEALERMLNEMPWDEIPDEYKQLVMNSAIFN